MAAKNEIALSLAVVLLAHSPAALAQQAGLCPTNEEAMLFGSNLSSYDAFGHSVAIAGDTLVAGAFSNGIDGAAYVFVRDGASWSEQALLVPSDGTGGDSFGYSVAISGDTVVVGATHHDDGPGAAYVFVRDGATWSEQQKLTASDGEDNDELGWDVAISGDTAVVSTMGHGLGGAAYVFVRDGTTWSEQQKLTASDAASGDDFGYSVAIEGDTVVVGATDDDYASLTNAGSAYVFVRNGTSWTEQQKLTAAGNGESGDLFGYSVAISGDTAVVGVPMDNSETAGNVGSAYVYARHATSWVAQQKIAASDGEQGDQFGYSASVSGDRIVVGAVFGDHLNKEGIGTAYAFVRNGTSWGQQQKLTGSEAAIWDMFGYSVAVSGDTTVAGAEGKDTAAGAAFVFDVSAWISDWVAYCTAGTSASGCQATLFGCGDASASASSGFALTASNVEAKKDGVFYFGTNGRQANPWGNGSSLQCVVPPVVRTGTLTGKGLLGTCDGFFSLDLNSLWCPTCPQSQKNPGAGAVVQAQLWYRDPASASNQTTSLSDAIEFPVHP